MYVKEKNLIGVLVNIRKYSSGNLEEVFDKNPPVCCKTHKIHQCKFFEIKNKQAMYDQDDKNILSTAIFIMDKLCYQQPPMGFFCLGYFLGKMNCLTEYTPLTFEDIKLIKTYMTKN